MSLQSLGVLHEMARSFGSKSISFVVDGTVVTSAVVLNLGVSSKVFSK